MATVKKTSKTQNVNTKKMNFKELNVNQLKWNCPKSSLRFKSSNDLKPLDKIVGQPRAIESIRLGAELFSKGYNIFVTGLSGTGRLSTVKKVLEDVTTINPTTFDFCYVNNFSNPDEPRLIKLPKGKGKSFAKSMSETISFLRERLPKLFEEDAIKKARQKIIENYQIKEKSIIDKFDKKINPLGFVRGQTESEDGVVQPEVFPVIDGKPIQIENLSDTAQKKKMSVKKINSIREKWQKLHNEVFELGRVGLRLMQEFKNLIYENDKKAASIIINSVFKELSEIYKNDRVDLYLEEVKSYISDNLKVFVNNGNPLAPASMSDANSNPEDKFSMFKVNVILDNSQTKSPPVVVETTPNYTNLFGTIERSFDNRGFWKTDYTKIKAGSLLRADQGYLIVNALDLFTEAGVWPALKRILLYDKLEIQAYEAIFQLSQLHLKPEPIDVQLKVIIIGGQTLYQWLYENEKGFKKIFKVNAQFDYETARSDEMIKYIARFISKITQEENFPPCTADGAAAIVEWAVKKAGSQKRITLKFSDIADVIREAAFYDRNNKKKSKTSITRLDVEKALECRKHRNNLLDDKIKYQILENNILIDTEGERIGQINGLTILNTGLIQFGKPARITATISAGSSGIINIEREVEMSGAIHNKAVLILSGFLRERFAKEKSLALTASIAFEQNYGGIDGDSATAAEIYILLSAIAEVPIKQYLAITGSVNQKGDIQPIGGINDKIQGFYEICKERGLRGHHGIVMPIQNVPDLMLSNEIIKSVKEKKFHIYPISKIEEGVEIMMGIKAGKLRSDGTYPEGTLFRKVTDKLEYLREKAEEKPKKKKKKIEQKTIKKTNKSLEEILEYERIYNEA